MEITNKFITPGIFLLITLASGFWLSSAGKPLNSLIFNIHKLLALAAVVFSVIGFRKTLIVREPQTNLVVLLIVCTVCVLALFATGGFMRAVEGKYDLWHNIHVAATIALVGLTALAAFFLFK